jgi:hypothetical protein
MTVRPKNARALFIELAESTIPPQQAWVEKVEQLSALCTDGGASTHIAFLGTAMLAKAVDESVDLYAIKPTHAKGNLNAYSARTLCHSVLVPLSAEYGVNLGVNGREPLNNQPYFRMKSLNDETPVHERSRPTFEYLIEIIEALRVGTSQDAKEALRAYIAVRRGHQIVYQAAVGKLTVTAATLASAIAMLVQERSEGGRRAQAVVAGLFDVFAGVDRVESGLINDPSRHYPGDVAVRSTEGNWEKAIEVRDKPVSESDIYIFGRKCLETGVREAAILLAATSQKRLNDEAIAKWSSSTGLGMTVFYGWPMFVDQALFWSESAKVDAVAAAVKFIEDRLIGVEASSEAVTRWHTLTR